MKSQLHLGCWAYLSTHSIQLGAACFAECANPPGLLVLCHSKSVVQVADAEAATARLVEQMAEPSAEEEAVAEAHSPMRSADMLEEEPAHKPVLNKEALPAAKKHMAAAHKPGQPFLLSRICLQWVASHVVLST